MASIWPWLSGPWDAGGKQNDDFESFCSDTQWGLPRLWTQHSIPAGEHEYWRRWVTVLGAVGDAANASVETKCTRIENRVASALTVPHTRRALAHAPENVATLLEVLVGHLESLRLDDEFCRAPPRRRAAHGVSPHPPSRPSGGRDREAELLTVLQLLTRVMPVVYEGDHDVYSLVEEDGATEPRVAQMSWTFEQQVLWTPSSNEPLVQAEARQNEEDGNDPLGAAQLARSSVSSSKNEPKSAARDPSCLGLRLLKALVGLLFFPGFTLPWTDELVADYWKARPAPRERYIIWCPGVGSSSGIEGSTPENYVHRVVILRLLMILLGRSLYHPQENVQGQRDKDDAPNTALHHLTTGYDRPIVLPFLCSLLNTVLAPPADFSPFSPPAAPTWTQWTKSLLSSVPDETCPKERSSAQLVLLSLQLLAILLSYFPSDAQSESEIGAAESERGQNQTTTSTNWFRYYMARLHRPVDYSLLWSGLSSWVQAGTQHGSSLSSSLLSSSEDTSTPTLGTAHLTESLVLLWITIKLNVGFGSWISLDPLKANLVLANLLHIILRYRRSESHLSLIRICSWMVHDLSSDKAWSASWAQSNVFPRHKLLFVSHLPAVPVKGSDALVLVAATLVPWSLTHRGAITNEGREEQAVTSSLLVAVRNSAAYWRDLSVVPATKLAQLMSSLSQPKTFLLGPPRTDWLVVLFEGVQRAYLAHPAEQVNLLYALATSASKDLIPLQNWDLPSALTQAGRLEDTPQARADMTEVRRKVEAYRNGDFVPTDRWIAEWKEAMQEPRETVVDNILSQLVPSLELFSTDVALKRHADQRVLAFVRDWLHDSAAAVASSSMGCSVAESGAESTVASSTDAPANTPTPATQEVTRDMRPLPLSAGEQAEQVGKALWGVAYSSAEGTWGFTRIRLVSPAVVTRAR